MIPLQPGKELNFSRGIKVIRLAKLLSRMSYLCFIHNSSEVISRHLLLPNGYACVLCTPSCAFLHGERNGLLGSCAEYVVHAHTIHESVIWRYTEVWQACTMTVWWGEMLNFYLHFICNTMTILFYFIFQKFSDTFHVQKYLRFLSKHVLVCILFLLILGKTNENLHLLDRARKKRKIKWKSSYINSPNCNLQFCIE